MRLSGKLVILIGDGPAADAKARLLERAGATIVGEDAPQAALAIVANGDEAAVARMRARGILVNAVDRPDLCDFTLPAIVDRDPVLVAIGTGGASAGLAAALRQRLETLLPARLGDVARALAAARQSLRTRYPDMNVRRHAIGALLAAGGPLDPLVVHDDPAASVAGADSGIARVEQVTLTSADPEDLTLRSARLLGLADRLYHRGDVPEAILDRARADAERIVGDPPAMPLPGLSLHIVRAAQ